MDNVLKDHSQPAIQVEASNCSVKVKAKTNASYRGLIIMAA